MTKPRDLTGKSKARAATPSAKAKPAGPTDAQKLARVRKARKELEKLEAADTRLGKQLYHARAELASALAAV